MRNLRYKALVGLVQQRKTRFSTNSVATGRFVSQSPKEGPSCTKDGFGSNYALLVRYALASVDLNTALCQASGTERPSMSHALLCWHSFLFSLDPSTDPRLQNAIAGLIHNFELWASFFAMHSSYCVVVQLRMRRPISLELAIRTWLNTFYCLKISPITLCGLMQHGS